MKNKQRAFLIALEEYIEEQGVTDYNEFLTIMRFAMSKQMTGYFRVFIESNARVAERKLRARI